MTALVLSVVFFRAQIVNFQNSAYAVDCFLSYGAVFAAKATPIGKEKSPCWVT